MSERSEPMSTATSELREELSVVARSTKETER